MRRHWLIALVASVLGMTSPLYSSEGRHPVFETGMVITESGSYVLTREIPSNPNGPAITIAARRVVLDLNGFSVFQAPNTSDPAILISEPKADVLIRNGTIVGGSKGIAYKGSVPGDPDDSVRIEDVRVENEYLCIEVLNVSTARVRKAVFRGCPTGVKIGCPGCGSRSVEGEVVATTCLQCTTAIDLSDARGVTISHNQVLNESYGTDAILVQNSRSVVISDNNLAHGGIRLVNSQGLDVRGNSIQGGLTGVAVGISADSSSYSNRIAWNVIDGVNQDGILVEGSDSYIIGNTINNCGGFGLAFGASSSGNYYRGNLAAGNAGSSCSNPVGSDACLDGTGHVSGGDNVFGGVQQ